MLDTLFTTRYTVPRFENHDRWKVNRFFHCLTQNDRPQTSYNLAPYSGPAMLRSSDLEIQAQDSCSDTCLIDVWTITLTDISLQGLQHSL